MTASASRFDEGASRFGAPTHRLEAQIQATGRVLDISVQCIYLPGMMLVSFGDAATHTSELKVLKQPSGLDLGKMKEAFAIYNKVHGLLALNTARVADVDTLRSYETNTASKTRARGSTICC